jgi:hypothetical protein
MQRQDYIERLIAQIAAAIAAVLGAASAGRFEEAERDLEQAWRALGLRRADAMRLDDDTVRALLGAKTGLAARLFDAQAAVAEARGAKAEAAASRARAENLRATGAR